jgi:hypothetical protein
MRRLLTQGFLFACGTIFLLPRGAEAAAPTEPVSAIIAKVIARDEATQRQLATMEYHQATHTEQLDASGHVTHQQDAQMIVRPGAAKEIEVVSVKGDRIPTDPDEAEQKAKGQEVERRKHNFSLKNLATRFNVSLVGSEIYRGRPAYILGFEPKPNQPYNDQTEKVLNQLHGRMWVSQDDDVVLKTEATLAQPVEVAWVFARIAKLDFSYELRTNNNDLGPAWLQVVVDVEAPFVSIRQRQTVDMDHFEQRSRMVAAEKGR